MRRSDKSGFTIIELLLALLVVIILAAIVAASFSSIHKRENNKERRSDITIIQNKLEYYFAKNDVYPTFSQINDSDWRHDNFTQIDSDVLLDPTSTSDLFVNKPKGSAYAYQVTNSSGKTCDNKKSLCTEYSLTATLEGGGTYVRSNIN